MFRRVKISLCDLEYTPARLWDVNMLKDVWTATVILHNMILEDEWTEQEPTEEFVAGAQLDCDLEEFQQWRTELADAENIQQFRTDLINQQWNLKGLEPDQ